MPSTCRQHTDYIPTCLFPISIQSACWRHVDGISCFEIFAYLSTNQLFAKISRDVGMFLQNSCRFFLKCTIFLYFLRWSKESANQRMKTENFRISEQDSSYFGSSSGWQVNNGKVNTTGHHHSVYACQCRQYWPYQLFFCHFPHLNLAICIKKH